MKSLKRQAGRFLSQEQGATMVEYGLMVALIALVCLGAINSLGVALKNLFNQAASAVSDAGT